MEVAVEDNGNPDKMQYDPAMLDAIKSAGFKSVRLFIVAGEHPLAYSRHPV